MSAKISSVYRVIVYLQTFRGFIKGERVNTDLIHVKAIGQEAADAVNEKYKFTNHKKILLGYLFEEEGKPDIFRPLDLSSHWDRTLAPKQ